MIFWSSTRKSYLNRKAGFSDPAYSLVVNHDRILKIFAAVLLLLFLLVTLITSKEATLNLDPKSPDGTVQKYLTALFKGDHLKAAKFFAPESLCTVQDLDRVYSSDAARAVLVKTEITGNSANVSVRVEYQSSDPFGTEWGDNHTFRLSRTGDRWLFKSIPWPLYQCGMITK